MSNSSTDGQVVAATLARSRAAQRRWQATPLRERLRPIRALRRLLAAEHESLCAAAEHDLGKPAEETLACEILPLAEACRFLEREAGRVLKPRFIRLRQRPVWLWGEHDAVHRRPRGLVGIVGTWNYPFLLNGVQIAQALVAGNAVLWKPSELAPHSADVLWSLFCRSGLPEGLVERLPGTREAGRELVQADIDHLVFTGHSETGRAVAAALAPRLVTSSLELSGCDSLLVLDDADLELAARAAWFGATFNRGQTCLAVRRAFVQQKVYERFLEKLQPLADAAAPVQLVQESQAKLARRLIDEAILAGAKPLVEPPSSTGGRGGAAVSGPASGASRTQPRPSDAAFRPMVLADARPDMALCRQATFAPVLAVIPFDRTEEALAAQEQCVYALGASIFTSNPARAARIAQRLRVGMVCVNDVLAAAGHPATPVVAQSGSGWGATQGREGLLEMTVPQVVSTRSGSWRPHLEPLGTNAWTRPATLEALLRLGHAKRWGTRMKSLWRLCRAMLPWKN
jgi:acyl-CoA reductase-like NAD-dependent aldehyde dehydrogenase